MSLFNTVFLSLMGGIMPSLLWLWFWLKEDKLHPEPKARVALTFIAGMVSVAFVLPVEKLIYNHLFSSITFMTIVLWAATEELFKFIAAYLSALKMKDTDEPIDQIIYMITAALGFSAIENSLFLSNLINSSPFSQSIITGNTRFLGATLLHVASSAVIGIMLGFSYYKKPLVRNFFLFTGLIMSIVLHTAFNLSIIEFSDNIFLVFSGVWVLIVVLIITIEKIKRVYR